MTLLLRDPTAEISSELRPRHTPLKTLDGKCVALLASVKCAATSSSIALKSYSKN